MPMDKVAHLYIKPTDGVEWGAPKTIRQLIAQLETMDADLPVHGALHVELGGKRMARCRHLCMSFERVDAPWIKQGDESIPYSLVFWTQVDEGVRVDALRPVAGKNPLPAGDDEKEDTLIAIEICDAVLRWIVEHDLGDRDDEFTASDVTSILDDLWGEEDDKPGDPKAAEAVLRELVGAAPTSAAEPIDAALIGVDEVVKESGGGWKPCSGCYDTEDGHPTRKYDYSRALKTDVGCGCHECGGLGAVWEYYSEADLAEMQKEFMA